MQKSRFLLFLLMISSGFIFAQELISEEFAPKDTAQTQACQLQRINWKLGKLGTTEITSWSRRLVLQKEQLQLLLSNEQFMLYKRAQKCYITSIPLLTRSVCGLVVSAYYLGAGIKTSIHPISHHPAAASYAFMLSGLFFIATLPHLVSGVVLIVYGTRKLNSVVADYNTLHQLSHQREMKVNFGFTQNGIGFNLFF